MGISQAELQIQTSAPFAGTFSLEIIPHLESQIQKLKHKVQMELIAQGAEVGSIEYEESINMRYIGTDTNMTIVKPDDGDYGKSFVQTHLREFAFVLSRDIAVDSINVRGVGHNHTSVTAISPYIQLQQLKQNDTYMCSTNTQRVYIDGGWKNAPIYHLNTLSRPTKLNGPALIIDATQTIFVAPLFETYTWTAM